MKNLIEAPQFEQLKKELLESVNEYYKQVTVKEYPERISIMVEGMGGIGLKYSEKHQIYVLYVAKNVDVPNQSGKRMLEEKLNSFMRAWNMFNDVEVNDDVWFNYLESK